MQSAGGVNPSWLAGICCRICIHRMNRVNSRGGSSCNDSTINIGIYVIVIVIIVIIIFRLHHSTTYVDAAYFYRPSRPWSVAVMRPAKTAEPIKMLFGLWTRVGKEVIFGRKDMLADLSTCPPLGSKCARPLPVLWWHYCPRGTRGRGGE